MMERSNIVGMTRHAWRAPFLFHTNPIPDPIADPTRDPEEDPLSPPSPGHHDPDPQKPDGPPDKDPV